jgi:hypothetical protein
MVVNATVWQVGPLRTYTNCTQVAPLVQDGDTVEIDDATFVNQNQVAWTKNNLLIRGAGANYAKLVAGADLLANTNGKGIFVVSGANVEIERIEFSSAKVIDNNGAGIRMEGANLYVHHCDFTQNEMGILTGAIPNSSLRMEYCVFSNNGSTNNPGYQHNVYVGHIDSFLFRYNISKDAIAEGHELKSRASYNEIVYNQIANITSVDSRTIDLPNGGIAILVGNYIEQGPNSANSNIIGYGLEGLTNPMPNRLYLASNTIVNKASFGSFIDISQGVDSLVLLNNIVAGTYPAGYILGSATHLDSNRNLLSTNIADCQFKDPLIRNYDLLVNSPAVDAGITTGRFAYGVALDPSLEFKGSTGIVVRPMYGTAIDIGANEYTPALSLPPSHTKPSFWYVNADIIALTVKDPHTLKLFNVLGCAMPLSYNSVGNTVQIDLSNLARDVYFLQVDGAVVKLAH